MVSHDPDIDRKAVPPCGTSPRLASSRSWSTGTAPSTCSCGVEFERLLFASVKDQLDLGEPVRHSAMLGVWTAMMRLQTAGKYNVAPLGVTAAGDVDLHAPSYFRWDDPDDQTLAELDDETDWFLGEEALDEIRDILDGGTWGEHSLNAIADVIRNTGRDVHRAI
jgi:hypothetical protein